MVAPGAIGNLLVKGDSMCAGYWNQAARTRTVMDGGWMRTGDKYSQDDDGFFWYAGRADDMLKVGGIWVSPVEVENALLEHAAVLECAVVGVPDRDGLVKPIAYVVLAEGMTASPALADDLIRWVRQRLPEYKRPRRIEFIDAVPKTATGKIQRFKLREPDRG
jgi:acyl-coenzyme A synthetase/AMP-(fatty) acid ligase